MRLPLWVWLSVARVGFALLLFKSVVAVQEGFALGGESVCAGSARLELRHTAIAISVNRAARERFVADMLLFSSPERSVSSETGEGDLHCLAADRTSIDAIEPTPLESRWT